MISDRTGQQLGHYTLLRLLGRGGFAEVYLGQHRYLQTHAAIKVLYGHLYALDAASGKQRWRYQTGSVPTPSPVLGP
jgi:outer membrane protein assembly factor BamB